MMTPQDQQELERKFLVSRANARFHRDGRATQITQGYLIVTDTAELRVRHAFSGPRPEETKYTQTLKFGGTQKARGEPTIQISKDEFDLLFAHNIGFLEKDRYKVPSACGNVFEINFFRGENEGCFLIEVEFDTPEEMDAFEPPEWFGREVTHDSRYYGQSIALFGFPDDTAPQTLDLKPGITRVIELIDEELKTKSCVFVPTAGGSASGKTSFVAGEVEAHYQGRARTLSMDMYYLPLAEREAKMAAGIDAHLDHPEAFDFELLQKHYEALRAGRAIQRPNYSFETGDRIGYTHFEPAEVIIVEGLFTLHEKIAHLGDVRIFVDISPHGRFIRRLMRDKGASRTPWSSTDSIAYMAQITHPAHEAFIQPTIEHADLIIRNEYTAALEAHRTEQTELQVKFRGTLNQKVLDLLLAHPLGSADHLDRYVNPPGHNLAATGESVRLRETGDSTWFTYKGPKHTQRPGDEPFRERQKMDVPVDGEIHTYLLGLYEEHACTVTKKRKIFRVGNILICLDTNVQVTDAEGNSEILGNFIEFHTTAETSTRAQLKTLIEQAQLSEEDGDNRSYVEMFEAKRALAA